MHIDRRQIPPRASARPNGNVRVRPMYPRVQAREEELEDISAVPTQPPATAWKYESPFYEAESSLPALSVAISEFSPLSPRTDPALGGPDPLSPEVQRPSIEEHSPATNRRQKVVTDRLSAAQESDIAEFDTYPPARAAQPSMVQMSPASNVQMGLNGSVPSLPGIFPAVSKLRSGQGAMSLWDSLRWWLLYPRRIEFVLWVSGSLLLLGVTVGLVLLTTLSLSMQTARQPTHKQVP